MPGGGILPGLLPKKMKLRVLPLITAILISCPLSYAQAGSVAIRTNLLLPLLNAGLEVPLPGYFSISGDFYFPWLGYDSANSYCLQVALADLQVHWWLNPLNSEGQRANTMTRWAVSLGTCMGKYDLERNMKGFQGEIICLYLDCGYTFRLAGNFRLTLSAGAGVAQIPYREYTVYSEGGGLIMDKAYDIRERWAGPIHAGVVLSLPVTGGVHR